VNICHDVLHQQIVRCTTANALVLTSLYPLRLSGSWSFSSPSVFGYFLNLEVTKTSPPSLDPAPVSYLLLTNLSIQLGRHLPLIARAVMRAVFDIPYNPESLEVESDYNIVQNNGTFHKSRSASKLQPPQSLFLLDSMLPSTSYTTSLQDHD
jgi:hypothetical protein